MKRGRRRERYRSVDLSRPHDTYFRRAFSNTADAAYLLRAPVPAAVAGAHTACRAQVDYPSSDGQPMAETDHQRTPLTYAVDALRLHFRDRPDVYVSGNLFMYYQEGNPRAVVAPDVFVVLGADNADRSTYRLWEEPKGPDFVLEITSRSTRREDQVSKRELYRSLRVQEYWQFDPTHDYLEPPLQGLELVAGGVPPRARNRGPQSGRSARGRARSPVASGRR